MRAIDVIRRHTTDTDYYFLINQRTDAPPAQSVTLEAGGAPFALNTLSGKIARVANYVAGNGRVTVTVSLAPNRATVIGVSTANLDGAAAPGVHASSTTADEARFQGSAIAIRVSTTNP